MHIEKGTDTTLRQVPGGSLDGAWGHVVSTELVDGETHVTVRLASGKLVTYVEPHTAIITALDEHDTSVPPREIGS